MARFTHVNVVLSGGWVSGSYWDEEIAQTGFRVACWPQTTSPDTDALLPVRDCETTYEVIDDSTFSGIQGFDAEAEYWDQPDQLEIAQAGVAWINAVKGYQSSKFAWTSIKLSPIGTDGNLAASSTLLTLKSPILGSNNSTQAPPQLSIATSFRTGVPGRRGRGRMYLPALHNSLTTVDGTVGSTTRTGLANAGRALLNGIESVALGVEYRLVVTSAKNPRYVLPQQVRVGDQFDVQRRRRNAVREAYTVA